MISVRFARRAEAQVRRIDAWWHEHRPSASDLFRDELADAVALLRAVPDVGVRYVPAPSGRFRRLILRESQCHLYYTHDKDRAEVVIVALWGSRRGRGPMLR